MRSAWKSDRGLVRETNEDFVLADDENAIFLLADGMGGGPGGEVASELAVIAAHELLARELAHLEAPVSSRLLADAVAAAHSIVAKRAILEPALQGMGTTLEVVVCRDGEAFLCHVGDSRIYLFRQDRLHRLTTDDNYATYLAESHPSPENIPESYRHVLTQAIGVSEEIVPELMALRLRPGDLLLICSDGLSGILNDWEMEEVIRGVNQEVGSIPESLVASANARGGADNVSVLVVEPIPVVAPGTLPAASG